MMGLHIFESNEFWNEGVQINCCLTDNDGRLECRIVFYVLTYMCMLFAKMDVQVQNVQVHTNVGCLSYVFPVIHIPLVTLRCSLTGKFSL